MLRVNAHRMGFLIAMVFASSMSGTGVALAKLQSSITEWTKLSSKKGGIATPGLSAEQTVSLVLDADKAGINDFIIASRERGPSIVGYCRAVHGWTKYVIDSSPLPIEAGWAAVDIDGDGDLDMISIGWSHRKVLLYQNKAIDSQRRIDRRN